MVGGVQERTGSGHQPRRSRKVTYLLPSELLNAIDAAVAAGAAPSKNALVERALVHELADIHRQERRARLEAASRDPLFLRDVAEIENDFRFADVESARQIV